MNVGRRDFVLSWDFVYMVRSALACIIDRLCTHVMHLCVARLFWTCLTVNELHMSYILANQQ